jgi:hypothetical protein
VRLEEAQLVRGELFTRVIHRGQRCYWPGLLINCWQSSREVRDA